MQRATDREIEAARRVAEAMVAFLIALDEGRRLRTPEQPQPQFEVKLPEFPPAAIPKPETAGDLKPPPADPGQLIGVDKVAELLECSPRHVYWLADCGRLGATGGRRCTMTTTARRRSRARLSGK